MLRTDDLDYNLPAERIATEPVWPRDSARLLVTGRSAGSDARHLRVSDLPELLRAGDLLVVNTSRVLPARFVGHREDTRGHVEGLYLREGRGPGEWVAMVKARRFRPGAPIRLHESGGGRSPFLLRLVERASDEGEEGAWIVRVERGDGGAPQTPEVLDRVGLTPLPPYILAARKSGGERVDESRDRASYQTVYAGSERRTEDGSEAGSVAAPTAGLHFTPALLERLASAGVGTCEVLLHVGSGTFKPVETEFVEEHPIHSEWCSMARESVEAIRRTREAGGRVVCVGTTSVRTVETYARALAGGGEPPAWLRTRLLITPGFEFLWTDGLMTNFHLPRSTLMALVGAMLEGGVERLKAIYGEAVVRSYRFYSYGDAMLILP